jgi:membrane protein
MPPSGSSTGKQLESAWKLGGLTFWQLTREVIHGIQEDDLFGRASELAYNFLLALFPLLLFMLTLFGLFASRSNELQSSLLSYFADFLPPSAFQLLKAITIEMAANATSGKLTFGIVLTLWFASGGMSSMISTLDAVYHVRESRGWLWGRVIALGLTIAILTLLMTSLFIVLVGGHFSDWANLLLWTEPGATPVALDDTRLNFWCIPLAGGFGGTSRLPAFLQHIHGDLWISCSNNDSPRLALRHRTVVPHRWGD